MELSGSDEHAFGILHRLHNEVKEAQARLDECVEDHFQPGSYHEIPYSNGLLRGEVVRTAGTGLCLRLDSTGRKFWVDAWWAYSQVPLKGGPEDV